ncbi:response regulator [Stenomitos frigidus ULC18]|uniref:Response regulator n=2 Tax=Stenomitos TaxID=1844270 RepID=A0A2T1EHE9_9CYAN|nr:response regulator [Stenomitos frigidus ULC18]
MVSNHRLLAVDDDEDSLLLLAQTLARPDRSLATAQNGKTALRLAQTWQPSMILLDIVLPDLSGFDVVQQLKQNAATANIPIIAVTALARADDRQKLLQAGCHECVSKPYLLEDLELAVDRCLDLSTLACA